MRVNKTEDVEMLDHELLKDERILIVTPHGPLESSDFAPGCQAFCPCKHKTL